MLQIIIAGVNGNMGRLFARLCGAKSIPHVGIDLQTDAHAGFQGKYVQGDITQPNQSIEEALASCNTLLACLPEETAETAFPSLWRRLPADSLWVDTLSVKTTICALLSGGEQRGEALSINPMFAPSVGFAGQNIAVVAVHRGKLADRFLAMLTEEQAHLVDVTAEQHDRLTASIQVATHAAIIAYGLSLVKLNYSQDLASRMTTPPHTLLLALLARVAGGVPEVYWDIQSVHPYAQQVREALSASLKELQDIVLSGDKQAFGNCFRDIVQMLGPGMKDLQQTFTRAIAKT